MSTDYFVHPSATVSDQAQIGCSTKIWNLAQIRERAVIGAECIVSKNVYIDSDVKVGSRCKIQNNSSLYHGVRLEDGVFVGPHVIFTNDKIPRAINPDGTLKSNADWIVGDTVVCFGASIGAGAVILPNVRVGRFAMVGSGAIVTKDVPDFALVVGNPAQVIGKVNELGEVISRGLSSRGQSV